TIATAWGTSWAISLTGVVEQITEAITPTKLRVPTSPFSRRNPQNSNFIAHTFLFRAGRALVFLNGSLIIAKGRRILKLLACGYLVDRHQPLGIQLLHAACQLVEATEKLLGSSLHRRAKLLGVPA